MPRTLRLVLPDVPLHVTQRGNNRAPTFRDHSDFEYYLRVLLRSSRQFDCRVHAYVLMTNHVHILLTPSTAEGASRMLQALNRSYVRHVNFKYARSGTLWEGRFRSAVVSMERYFLACSRYIELNPVRAGMVRDPADYPWSSYGHNVAGISDPVVSPHPIYLRLARNPGARRHAYRALFNTALDPEIVGAIRMASRHNGIIEERGLRQRTRTRVRFA